MVYVSTRHRFRRGDEGWDSYIAFIGLPSLVEVITVDSALNRCVDACGDFVCELDEVASLLPMLPKPKSADELYLVAAQVGEVAPASPGPGFELAGYDMSDETMTSSLLNCGPWTGALEPFVRRLNRFGLLSLEDARAARALLPRVWGAEEPHANADLWAIFIAPFAELAEGSP